MYPKKEDAFPEGLLVPTVLKFKTNKQNCLAAISTWGPHVNHTSGRSQQHSCLPPPLNGLAALCFCHFLQRNSWNSLSTNRTEDPPPLSPTLTPPIGAAHLYPHQHLHRPIEQLHSDQSGQYLLDQSSWDLESYLHENRPIRNQVQELLSI